MYPRPASRALRLSNARSKFSSHCTILGSSVPHASSDIILPAAAFNPGQAFWQRPTSRHNVSSCNICASASGRREVEIIGKPSPNCRDMQRRVRGTHGRCSTFLFFSPQGESWRCSLRAHRPDSRKMSHRQGWIFLTWKVAKLPHST